MHKAALFLEWGVSYHRHGQCLSLVVVFAKHATLYCQLAADSTVTHPMQVDGQGEIHLLSVSHTPVGICHEKGLSWRAM